MYLAALQKILKIKLITSLFVQKPYFRTIYIESNIEEDMHMKSQYRFKNLKDPISIRETASRNYVDTFFNDPSSIKITAHVDFNDKNLEIVRFVEVKQYASIWRTLNSWILCWSSYLQ